MFSMYYIFLGILALLIAFLVIYFENQIKEQNKKMSYMLNIISSLEQQIIYINTHIIKENNHNDYLNNNNNNNNINNNNPFQSNLINVSDDDNNDSEDASDDDLSNDDESEDDASDNDGSDDDESDNESINKKDKHSRNLDNHFTILQDNVTNDIDISHDINDIDITNDIDIIEDNDLNNTLNENNNNIKILKIDNLEHISDLNTELNHHEPIDFKKINLVEETKNINSSEEVDHKKMSVSVLRNIVLEKGLSTDPSKIKKPELLKLLGIE